MIQKIKKFYRVFKSTYMASDMFSVNPRFTSWYPVLDFISEKKDKNILELGLGSGTKHLLENFKKVYSFEVFHTRYWYDYTVKENKDYKNWEHIFYYSHDFGINDADAELVATKGKVRRTEVLKKYFELLEKWVDTSKIDVVFVDQGFHFRGECAKYFLEKGIPYVICDDWNQGEDDFYGYRSIKKYDGYNEELYKGGMGDKIYIKS